MGVFSTILGTGKVVEKGMDLIDSKFPSDVDMLEAKTKAKVDLMNSYQGFKVAQRYLALLFSTTYVLCFFLVLGRVLLGYDNALVLETVHEFQIDVITLVIVVFYFGGGAAEGMISRLRSPKGS